MSTRNQMIAHWYTEEKLTLAEIGQQVGISRERVRQILVSQGVTERHYGAKHKEEREKETRLAHQRISSGETTLEWETAYLQLAPGTLSSRFSKLGLTTPRRTAEHGTRSRYVGPEKCRCTPCRMANSVYMQQLRRRRKESHAS